MGSPRIVAEVREAPPSEVAAKKQKSKQTVTEITQAVEARIVEVSLKHPDYGGGRLVPLLAQERIFLTPSAVYNTLKRNNLQNRTLRLSKLEEQRAAGMLPETTTTIEPQTEEPTLVPAPAAAIASPPQVSAAIESPSKREIRRPWSLTISNILLLGLIGYFSGSALTNLLQVWREPGPSTKSVPAEATSKAGAAVRPLAHLDIIVERNLFGGSGSETPAPEETVALEDIPAAEKIRGLKLVGTVAGDDSEARFAIIDNEKTRKQELYREGNTAGEVLIKTILRNNVIVNAGKGEELLVLQLEEKGKKIGSSPASKPLVDSKLAANRGIPQSIHLDRREIDSSLGSVDQLARQANISAYWGKEQPAGFTITDLEPDGVFARMGLRNGDVIIGVNDQAITGPEQADEILQTLKDGGDVSIKVKRRRGLRQRTRVIRFNIE